MNSITGGLKAFDELMHLSPSSPFGVFSYYCDNLGDHIQTLALLQHIRPRAFVLRDHIAPDRELSLIANGWLTSGPLPQVSDFRHLRYVGVHVAPHVRTAKTIDALRPCGVIGCRDSATLEFLSRNEIPAVLTRCATLTFPAYHGERKGVYCVDVPDDVVEAVAARYGAPARLSHDLHTYARDQVDYEMIHQQFGKAYQLLERYQTAELVVTTRIHATLPCIGFETPVIYVGVTAEEDDRVTVLEGLGVRIATNQVRNNPDAALARPKAIDSAPLRDRFLRFLGEATRGIS